MFVCVQFVSMDVRMRISLPKLRGRIAELGVRQFDVARRLGIDPAVLSAYLRGHRKPPEDFPQQLTDVLDNMEDRCYIGSD